MIHVCIYGYIYMIHVTHTNESCYIQDMPHHISINHVAYFNMLHICYFNMLHICHIPIYQSANDVYERVSLHGNDEDVVHCKMCKQVVHTCHIFFLMCDMTVSTCDMTPSFVERIRCSAFKNVQTGRAYPYF